MNYRIKRGDREFGPYSLADLQHYVQTGHVLAQDLAQSEGMSEWVPVVQVLGNIPVPSPMTINASQATLEGREAVKLPPNLPWQVLLVNYLYWVPVIGILISFFVIVWTLIQANWARKLSGKNTALVLMAMLPVGALSGGFAVGIGKTTGTEGVVALGGFLILAGAICLIVGNFKIRDAMEEYYNSVENIGLSLSGVMIFFFGLIYIQYHVNRLARWKATGELS
jgi:GYF domain 2